MILTLLNVKSIKIAINDIFNNIFNKRDVFMKEMKEERILTPIDKALETLKNLKIEVDDTEKAAIADTVKCDPNKLFRLISWAAIYRATASSATEIYPNDLDIKTHNKNASKILFGKTQDLVSKFERECRCRRTYMD